MNPLKRLLCAPKALAATAQAVVHTTLLKWLDAARALAVLALVAASPMAVAGGWITGFTNVTALSNAGITTVIRVFFMIGLAAIGYAGKLAWDKGGERGEDIKTGRIVYTFIGGSVMVALSYFALQTVQTLGGTAADVGAAP